MSNSQAFFLGLSRVRRRIFHNWRLARFVILGAGVTALLIILLVISLPLLRVGKDILFGPVGIFSMFGRGAAQVKHTEGRTNILLLGVGDASHEGPDLTDSMMVVSVKTQFASDQEATKYPVVLISIPRDIYLESLRGKINTAYALGAPKGKEAGRTLSAGAVREVTGLPIHYTATLDFSGFVKMIDLLGGIDVAVEHKLDDPYYPVEAKREDDCGMSEEEIAVRLATMSGEEAFPCRYEHLYLEPGVVHMDGSLALKFSRSRFAEGDEGTDFARAARQQLVIQAVKNKVFSSETLLNFSKLEGIYNTLKRHISTDAEAQYARGFFDLAVKYRGTNFKSVVLGDQFFDNPPIDERGWILLPKDGNFKEIHEYIKKQIEK